MKAGFVGLGKLGLPVSVAMSWYHDVYGYEARESKRNQYRAGVSGLYEPDLDQQLATANRLRIVDSMKEAVKDMDIVFFAVQTPSREDDSFDTSSLVEAVKDASQYANDQVFVVISTVLPGTMRSEIDPIVKGTDVQGLMYNASFIAMGTTIADFLTPEFVLIGHGDPAASSARRGDYELAKFYESMISKEIPRLHMTWENAELVKMVYNTMIGFKIVYANTLMELCHKLPTGNVDTISQALSHATKRIVGPAYLRGGMGDGGACHPRDNLALSWLAKKHDLSANPFEFVMAARQRQARWLAKMMVEHDSPYYILGARYKPGTNLTDYSASLLVYEELNKLNPDKRTGPFIFDPLSEQPYGESIDFKKGTFLIAIQDAFVQAFHFPTGSTILDPWRCLKTIPDDCHYVPIGVGP